MYYECCKILGVRPDATIEEIKKTFREKAKKYHPDLNNDLNAGNYFIAIKNAFDYIIKYRTIIDNKTLFQEFIPKENNSSSGPTFYNFYSKQYYKNIKYQKIINESFERRLIFINIIFYLLFIFLGMIMIISPTYSTIKNGINEEENTIIKVFLIFVFTIFGFVTTTFLIHNLLKYCAENNIKIRIKTKVNHD